MPRTPRVGLKAFEEQRNRYWLIDNQLQAVFRPLRQCLYDYHRSGLDTMTEDPQRPNGPSPPASKKLKTVHQAKPVSYNMQVFFNAKYNELVGSTSPSPAGRPAVQHPADRRSGAHQPVPEHDAELSGRERRMPVPLLIFAGHAPAAHHLQLPADRRAGPAARRRAQHHHQRDRERRQEHLLGALGLATGERAESGIMRDPASRCVIELEVQLDPDRWQGWFQQAELPWEPSASSAANWNRTAGPGPSSTTPVRTEQLRELGAGILHVHSQHHAAAERPCVPARSGGRLLRPASGGGTLCRHLPSVEVRP